MEQMFTTVSSKGQMVIPIQFREALGIKAGTQVAIRREGSKLILLPETEVTTQQLIEELCGITAGGYSMADDLIAERRADDEKAGW
jgi:AbrB family looped-hinge helix DNA binding protein